MRVPVAVSEVVSEQLRLPSAPHPPAEEGSALRQLPAASAVAASEDSALQPPIQEADSEQQLVAISGRNLEGRYFDCTIAVSVKKHLLQKISTMRNYQVR